MGDENDDFNLDELDNDDSDEDILDNVEQEDNEDNDDDITGAITGDGDEDGNEDEDEDEEDYDDELLKSSDKEYSESNNYSNFTISDHLEENDSQDFLQKFTSELKDNLIINNHPEYLSKNFEEIKILSQVKRDKNNIIIDELHRTNPFLSKYEKTRILGIRLKQLNNNSKPLIEVGENIIDNYIIAKKELEEKKLPFIIQRPIPNNTFEYWKLQDLELI